MVRVLLHHWSDEWPEQYERERGRIVTALGGAVVAVHHTGSTSVGGLMAKPVIDITLVVPATTDEDAYRPGLERVGYEFCLREPHWYEHRLFRREVPRVNLHVFPAGCQEVDRMVAFRDRLRTDVADRLLYETVKRTLAGRDWPTVQHYADAKTDVIADILGRARWQDLTTAVPAPPES